MTPKEKAEELVFKKFGCKKGYALNTVDEIITTLNHDIKDIDVVGNVLLNLIEYWNKVKQEIEKL